MEALLFTLSMKEWTMGALLFTFSKKESDGVSTLHFLNEGVDDGSSTLFTGVLNFVLTAKEVCAYSPASSTSLRK